MVVGIWQAQHFYAYMIKGRTSQFDWRSVEISSLVQESSCFVFAGSDDSVEASVDIFCGTQFVSFGLQAL